MTRYSKYNIIYRLQKWMDSVPGQTFLNYAYSWGASIVILGTLFKLTHLPGANFFLFLGMGTEVLVFFISAFDRPFDKTTDGMELPTHLIAENSEVATDENAPDNEEALPAASVVQPAAKGAKVGGIPAGGTIIIGGGQAVVASTGGSAPIGNGTTAVNRAATATENDASTVVGKATPTTENAASAVAESATSSVERIAPVAATEPATTYSAPPLTPDMTDATMAYVEELKKLTEVLGKVSEQSRRLTTDSEEMENLNRTLTGICKVYEMQLKSASAQIGTIDQINEQTKKMAQQIEQLNQIYTRMIDAMTVNMRAAASGATV